MWAYKLNQTAAKGAGRPFLRYKNSMMIDNPHGCHTNRASSRPTVWATLALCLLLGGCLDRLFFKPDYTMTGLPAQAELAKDIEAHFKDQKAAIVLPENKSDIAAASTQASENLRLQMIAKLQSLGYYDAKASFNAGPEPWAGTYTLDPGARYRIARVKINTVSKLDAGEAARLEPLHDLEGQPLDAATVLTSIDKTRRAIDRNSCRFGVDLAHSAVIDRRAKTADLTFELQQGPRARMGPVVFNGQQTVNESYLQKLVPWRAGDCYSAQHIEDLRGALFQSGLFGNVDIVQPAKPAANGQVPLLVNVQERPHRAINIGATYYSDEGPGLQMGWKHRNLLGGAEVLDATLMLSSIEQSLKSTLTSPFFLRRDQKLLVTAGLAREETDAYDSKSIDTGIAVQRQINKQLALSTGINFSVSRIFDNVTLDEDNFALISFPQTASYDTRSNLLDPHKGWFIEAEAEPFFNTIGSGSPFFKL